MANRVNVNINVNDSSRAGLASLRQSMNRVRRDVQRAGGDVRFNIRIDEGTSRREMRRIQRSMRGQPVTITTRLDPPTPPARTVRQRIQRALGRAVTVPVRVTGRGMLATARGPLRALGGFASGTMQDGIGQGIIQGFRAGGPVGIAALTALLVSSVAVVGAALSGLLITALGLAFVGIAGASAATSKQVKAQWSSTLESLKENFREVGEPMIPVLTRALKIIESMADRATPAFKRAMEETTSATNAFIDGILKGFESFGKAAFQPIMDAWNTFAPIFGEEWNEFMDELGHSFKEMANLVKEHPTEIAMALDVVFEALDLLVDTITFFGQVWVGIVNGVIVQAGYLGKAIEFVGNAVIDVFSTIIDGAVSAFGWVPGLGPKLKDAQTAFGVFKEDARAKLANIGSAAQQMGKALDNANKKRRLEADIRSWQDKLSVARRDLKKTSSQKARARLTADISNLQSRIRRAKDELASINGRTATTYVRTVKLGIGAEAANAARRATGGVIGAAQTGGIRSNLTMVGEAGPELVRLPAGSHVRSNPDTRRFLGGMGGQGGGPTVIEINAAGDDISRLLLQILRRAIRVQGGDVQVVLGR